MSRTKKTEIQCKTLNIKISRKKHGVRAS